MRDHTGKPFTPAFSAPTVSWEDEILVIVAALLQPRGQPATTEHHRSGRGHRNGGDKIWEAELKMELCKPSKLLVELADSIHAVSHNIHSGVI